GPLPSPDDEGGRPVPGGLHHRVREPRGAGPVRVRAAGGGRPARHPAHLGGGGGGGRAGAGGVAAGAAGAGKGGGGGGGGGRGKRWSWRRTAETRWSASARASIRAITASTCARRP